MKKRYFILLILFSVLALDQAIKIWVKTSMCYGQNFAIFSGIEWARIHFVENPGMAFGWDPGAGTGKLLLSLFRLVAFGFLVWYINSLVVKNAPNRLIFSFTMILAGAIGNIIDSAIYGIIFSESSYHCVHPAVMFPIEGGYAGFLHGKVVDMFYFPMFEFTFPSWLPIWGGQNSTFFAPVFNVADAAITVGVVSLILFNREFFFHQDEQPQIVTETAADISAVEPDTDSAVTPDTTDTDEKPA